MALYQKATRQDGWLYQAENLVSTHRTVAFAGVGAAAKAREEALAEEISRHFRAPSAEYEGAEDTSPVELTNERQPADHCLDEIEPQAVLSNEQILHDQVEALAGQLAAVQQRIGELEANLGATYEQLDLQENENCSLQTSLDLLIAENSRLSGRLAESEALRVAAEKKREEAQLNLRTLVNDKAAAERDVAEAIDARDAAENKLEMQRTLLRLTDRQMQELEESRSTLIEGTSELLKTFETRDLALARSEARNEVLAERIAQLETAVKLASKPEKFEELKRQWARLERGLMKTAPQTTSSNGSAQQREPANESAPNGQSERAQKRTPQTVLAGTITFVNAR